MASKWDFLPQMLDCSPSGAVDIYFSAILRDADERIATRRRESTIDVARHVVRNLDEPIRTLHELNDQEYAQNLEALRSALETWLTSKHGSDGPAQSHLQATVTPGAGSPPVGGHSPSASSSTSRQPHTNGATKAKPVPTAVPTAAMRRPTAGSSDEVSIAHAAIEFPAAKPAPVKTPWHMPSTQLKEKLAELWSHGEALIDAAETKSLSLDRIEAEVRVLTYRTRCLQVANDSLASQPGFDRDFRHVFGRLSRVAKEFLAPESRFIYGLAMRDTGSLEDWMEEFEAAETFRENVLQDESQAAMREAEAKREEEARRMREWAADRSFDGLSDLLADGDMADEDDRESARELIGEYLTHVDAVEPRFVELITPFVDLVRDGSEFRAVRRALRRAGVLTTDTTTVEDGRAGSDEADQDDRTATETSDDPSKSAAKSSTISAEILKFEGFFRDETAAIVGGQVREAARQRIETFLGLKQLDWIVNGRGERSNHESIAQRILNGRYKFVLFLARYAGHHHQDKIKDACKQAGVPFVLIEHGYGLTTICLALQPYMERKAEGTDALMPR